MRIVMHAHLIGGFFLSFFFEVGRNESGKMNGIFF